MFFQVCLSGKHQKHIVSIKFTYLRHTLSIRVRCYSSVPDSNFLFKPALGSGGNGSSDWVPAIHFGGLSSWVWPQSSSNCPRNLRINHQIWALSLSLSLSVAMPFKWQATRLYKPLHIVLGHLGVQNEVHRTWRSSVTLILQGQHHPNIRNLGASKANPCIHYL